MDDRGTPPPAWQDGAPWALLAWPVIRHAVVVEEWVSLLESVADWYARTAAAHGLPFSRPTHEERHTAARFLALSGWRPSMLLRQWMDHMPPGMAMP